MDKKNFAFGVIFILIAIYCVFRAITIAPASYTTTGAIVFTIVGIGFIKKARGR